MNLIDFSPLQSVPSIAVESTSESSTVKKTSENDMKDDIISSLHSEIQLMMRDKRSYEKELQNYKRQQIQYQQQIAESDALLRDLRSREADSVEAISAKDSQIALLRVRLAESDEFVKSKTALCEQLQNQCARILQDHTDSTGLQSQAFDSIQSRLNQLEQEYQQRVHESERLVDEKQSFERHANEEKHQLIEQLKAAEKRLHDERLQFHEQQQQVKHSKNLTHQLEQDMQDYKAKAQRILQTKDKLIEKLKEIAQNRSNSKSFDDLQGKSDVNTHRIFMRSHSILLISDSESSSMNDETKLFDVHHVGNSSILTPGTTGSSPWASVQYEELKAENELFKQELQARELTIHTLRSELQEAELLVQHAENQLREQCDQLQEQLKDERMRLTLAEQDCRKLKQELAFVHEDFHRQKQVHLTQLNEREWELERLRLQLTAKTINHVNDDELEKRLQTLTESLIHKQTIIEALQTEKSSLTLQLERLEKRLEDYERIASMNVNNSSNSSSSSKRLQATTINMEMDSNSLYDNDHEDNLRYRIPMLRETPYDPDIAKKVKRAANEIDKLGIRLGIFLKRYPAVRLGVIFYAILLHLWTLIVLFTYKPEIHGNIHPLDFPHSS